MPCAFFFPRYPAAMTDIRDHAILRSTSTRLEELISACRRRGGIHDHSPNLAADVTRKAKALRTSLAGLMASLDGAAQPEQPMGRKKDLRYRVYFDPLLTEMVRFVGNAGRNELDFWDFYRDLAGRYTTERASAAYEELCTMDKSNLPATVFLKPEVRAMLDPLLGERGR